MVRFFLFFFFFFFFNAALRFHEGSICTPDLGSRNKNVDVPAWQRTWILIIDLCAYVKYATVIISGGRVRTDRFNVLMVSATIARLHRKLVRFKIFIETYHHHRAPWFCIRLSYPRASVEASSATSGPRRSPSWVRCKYLCRVWSSFMHTFLCVPVASGNVKDDSLWKTASWVFDEDTACPIPQFCSNTDELNGQIRVLRTDSCWLLNF